MEYIKKGVEVINLLEQSGHEAFFVGGFVRDYVLNLAPNDIDIATNALPNQISNIFEVVNNGIKFNSVTINYDSYSFETTTYRLDLAYSDNRHPTYVVADSLIEDLKRRDFTINAMAMDKDFNIIDNFGGMEDIKNKIIKTVYDPIRRFSEDALRMLRACYFAAKLDFTIEENTFSGIRTCSHLVQSLSNDRIMWELEKIINSNNSVKGLRYLKTTNILPYLLLFKEGINLILDKGYQKINWLEFLAICFYNDPLKLDEIHLKSGVAKRVRDVIELAKKTPKNDFNSTNLFDYGIELCNAANITNIYWKNAKDKRSEISNIYNSLPIHSISELKIKALDILDNIQLKNKKDINTILNEIKGKVLSNKLSNEKDEILNYIMKYYAKK